MTSVFAAPSAFDVAVVEGAGMVVGSVSQAPKNSKASTRAMLAEQRTGSLGRSARMDKLELTNRRRGV
ncbi:MAG: hypothetical protein M3404_00895 [Actinomycetota bacterium]|nr:hypothetical protein [Actinomycetota bacterium]